MAAGGRAETRKTLSRHLPLRQKSKNGTIFRSANAIFQRPASARDAARARLEALDRALDARDTLESAVRNTTTEWAMLAAIGIRETGFRNINQPDGNGVGVFQIDIWQNPSVSRDDAADLDWSARWAANTLARNRAVLAARFPNLTASQLLQATAASWNLGVGGISGNPDTIDVGSTGGNYGSNIVRLMDFFR